jgi:hypothetical protein
MITRRTILQLAGAALAVGSAPLRAATAVIATPAQAALGKSDLVYITPLKNGGAESTCHAEVWFAFDGASVFVVTSSKAWRARAIASGLNQARLWVGEYGEWKGAKDAYREAPELLTTAVLIDDLPTQSRALEIFGEKYRLEWLVWGPRFRNGLKDGSRVMLQYTPTGGALS